jgi:hypothetical protein
MSLSFEVLTLFPKPLLFLKQHHSGARTADRGSVTTSGLTTTSTKVMTIHGGFAVCDPSSAVYDAESDSGRSAP